MRMLTAPRAVPARFTGSGTMQAIALRAFRESRDTARSRAGACALLQYLDGDEAAQISAGLPGIALLFEHAEAERALSVELHEWHRALRIEVLLREREVRAVLTGETQALVQCERMLATLLSSATRRCRSTRCSSDALSTRRLQARASRMIENHRRERLACATCDDGLHSAIFTRDHLCMSEHPGCVRVARVASEQRFQAGRLFK